VALCLYDINVISKGFFMNFLRTIFRSLVVVVVVLVGNVSAVFQSIPERLNNNRCTLMGSIFANKMINKDDLLVRSAIETAFYSLDKASAEYDVPGSIDLSDLDVKDAAEHFLLNIAVRKASQEFGKRVITLDAVAKKCDELPVPAGVKYYLYPVVREIAEQVTEPEMLIFLTRELVSMLTSKNE
jgi:hypothetical protein